MSRYKRNFDRRAELHHASAYALLDWKARHHHERFVRFIAALPKKLVCQECGGTGGYTEPVLDYGEGPSFECGWCEGTGSVSPHRRGLWLRSQQCRSLTPSRSA